MTSSSEYNSKNCYLSIYSIISIARWNKLGTLFRSTRFLRNFNGPWCELNVSLLKTRPSFTIIHFLELVCSAENICSSTKTYRHCFIRRIWYQSLTLAASSSVQSIQIRIDLSSFGQIRSEVPPWFSWLYINSCGAFCQILSSRFLWVLGPVREGAELIWCRPVTSDECCVPPFQIGPKRPFHVCWNLASMSYVFDGDWRIVHTFSVCLASLYTTQ